MKRQYILLTIIIIGFIFSNKKMNSYLTSIDNWEIPTQITLHNVPILAFEFAKNKTPNLNPQIEFLLGKSKKSKHLSYFFAKKATFPHIWGIITE